MNIDQVLKKLIGFRTLSLDHGSNQEALAWITAQLSVLRLNMRQFSICGFPSLLVTVRQTKRPKVLLVGHLDVVSGSANVFSSKFRGDKLFGRGAFDMKFAIACYLNLFLELGRRNLKRLDLGILVTTDEEVGGANGTGALVKKGLLPKVCVLPDGGQNWEMQKGAKGILRLRVTARGQSAHGSRPWAGDNAIEKLMSFLAKLRSQFPEEPCGDAEHEHPTMNTGKIAGGQETNLIPDIAQADLDIRFPVGKKPKILRARGIGVEVLGEGGPFSQNITNNYIRSFAKLVKNRVGVDPKYITTHGSSDARYFVAREVPVIATRPVGGGHHTEREWISRKSLGQFYDVLKEFVLISARVS